MAKQDVRMYGDSYLAKKVAYFAFCDAEELEWFLYIVGEDGLRHDILDAIEWMNEGENDDA